MCLSVTLLFSFCMISLELHPMDGHTLHKNTVPYLIEPYTKERDHAFITECLAKDPHNFSDADKIPDLDSVYVAMDSFQTDDQTQKQPFKFKQTILVCCLDAQPVGFIRTLASPWLV